MELVEEEAEGEAGAAAGAVMSAVIEDRQAGQEHFRTSPQQLHRPELTASHCICRPARSCYERHRKPRLTLDCNGLQVTRVNASALPHQRHSNPSQTYCIVGGD